MRSDWLIEQLPEMPPELAQKLFEVLRRDWAVRVLDAWASDPEEERHWSCGDQCVLYRHGEDGSPDTFERQNIDAARLAAAEAIWHELPESVRAEIGERP